jgi:cytochrome c-type protein NapB
MTDPTSAADASPRDATTPLPRFVRRHASLVVVLVIGVAVGGFLRGIAEPAPPAPAAPPVRAEGDDVPAAVGYAELPAAPIKANDRWESVLSTLQYAKPAPTDPVTRTEEMKLAALADRSRNRAYDTAPPTVPHPIDQANPASCLACHGTGLWVKDRLAPKVSHPWLTNCTQCHAPSAALDQVAFPVPANGGKP